MAEILFDLPLKAGKLLCEAGGEKGNPHGRASRDRFGIDLAVIGPNNKTFLGEGAKLVKYRSISSYRSSK